MSIKENFDNGFPYDYDEYSAKCVHFVNVQYGRSVSTIFVVERRGKCSSEIRGGESFLQMTSLVTSLTAHEL